MKLQSMLAAALLHTLTTSGAFADFPISQSANWNALPQIVYNSADQEYLVIWEELISVGQLYLPGPVVGQRVSEGGTKLGNPFQIFPLGMQARAAYNSNLNEYLVVATPGTGIQGQRVSSTGTLLGLAVALMPEASYGRILYNSLSSDYLLAGGKLVENPPGSGYYHTQVYTRKVSATGSPLGSSLLVEDVSTPYTSDGANFAVAYAPITSPETPHGRYLLVVNGPGSFMPTMLNSDGAVINVVTDPHHPGTTYRYVPFAEGQIGGAYSFDVTFGTEGGYGVDGPAFLLVWADDNNKYQNTTWPGIWAGFINATKLDYTVDDVVQDKTFFVSWIYAHWTQPPHVTSWKPRVAYNPGARKYMVAWRETPGTEDLNDTKVNHIRANTCFDRIPPATNVVLSATAGTEEPGHPAIASSTVTGKGLVAWVDQRNFASTNRDIYGSIYTIADVPPPPPTTTWVVANTNDAGVGSLRQAILNANARAGLDTIAFNIPGTGVHTIQPASELPAITDPVLIDGYTQPGSSMNTSPFENGFNAVLKIELKGMFAEEPDTGLHVQSGRCVVRGMVINSFEAAGIVLERSGENVIEGNYIGTGPTGTSSIGNEVGVVIDASPNNLIGGTSAAARNIIAGNTDFGIILRHAGATGNLIQGNYIGVVASGNASVGSARGIWIEEAPSNTVGGTAPGAGNIICGCGYEAGPLDGEHTIIGYGILVHGDTATGNLIFGNLIGTNARGDSALENFASGVSLCSNGNTVGGTAPEARNVISGNHSLGLEIVRSNNIVQGNYIGTDITGSKPIANAVGVEILLGAENIIGGHTPGAGNVISGNDWYGVIITGQGAERNRVEGNLIGVQAEGNRPLGNGVEGVLITSFGNDNIVGGPAEGAGNTIAFNGGHGVSLTANTTGNTISRNSIWANGGLGINLEGGTEASDGVTSNDPGDDDTGPNGCQNFPVLTTVEGGDFVYLSGSLNSTPNSTFTLEFFATPAGDTASYREGQMFLGWTEVTTDSRGDVDFATTIGIPVAAGRHIVATATDPHGCTSEFSEPVLSTEPVAVERAENLPRETALLQNYPNPFNPTTGIKFQVAGVSDVKITVYDLLGREVAALVNEVKQPGYYETSFGGAWLSSGVYLYRMTAGSFVATRAMLLVK